MSPASSHSVNADLKLKHAHVMPSTHTHRHNVDVQHALRRRDERERDELGSRPQHVVGNQCALKLGAHGVQRLAWLALQHLQAAAMACS